MSDSFIGSLSVVSLLQYCLQITRKDYNRDNHVDLLPEVIKVDKQIRVHLFLWQNEKVVSERMVCLIYCTYAGCSRWILHQAVRNVTFTAAVQHFLFLMSYNMVSRSGHKY